MTSLRVMMSFIIDIESSMQDNRDMPGPKNRLRRLRFDKDETTQQQLADAVGVARQTINSIEKGKFNPSVMLALKIAEYFGCPLEDVFYLETEEAE